MTSQSGVVFSDFGRLFSVNSDFRFISSNGKFKFNTNIFTEAMNLIKITDLTPQPYNLGEIIGAVVLN